MLPVFALARTGASLYAIREATGVLGFDEWVMAVARIVPKLHLRVHRRDRAFVDEMVDRARQRVPVDTGTLLNGIEGRDVDDDMVEFRASAVHADKPNSKEDYAHFVEFGTTRGVVGAPAVADESFFSDHRLLFGGALTANRARKSYRRSGGAAAQPFFYNSAEEVLAKRNMSLDDAAPDVAREEGFEVR